MKSYKVLSLRTLSLVTLMALLSLASCKKDTEQPAVNISGFTPTQGTVGTNVTISGNNFSTNALSNVVTFNGTAATVTNATATSIVVTVPTGATSGKINVTSEGKSATSTSDFTILAPPTIVSFAPTSGSVSSSVVIIGTNFDTTPANNVVTFNGTTATVTAATTTSLTVTVPTGATTGKVSVTVNGIVISSATDFTVVSGPTVTGFTPATGRTGTIIVITGTNFDTNVANNTVKFGTATAQVAIASATQLVVLLPAGATTGKIAVSANSVTGNSLTDFTVLSDPYANFRVKEVDGNDGSTDKYTYDANNNLIEEVYDDTEEIFDDHYTYSAGLLSTDIYGTTTSFKKAYVYNNGVLTQLIESSAPVNGGVIGTYSVDNISNYTFENGLLSTLIYQDASQTTLSKRVYTYSIVNGNLQQTITHTAYSNEVNPSTVFTIIYSSDFNPTPSRDQSDLINIPISFQNAGDATENYTSTYTFDASGKISTVKTDYADPSQTDVTYTFTYEAKQ